MRPDIKEFRQRLANITIGPTTLRNQGAPGVVAIARGFLMRLELEKFVTDKKSDFLRELNKQTNILCDQFPTNASSWGAARKAINLFLAEAYYHRFICEAYRLETIENLLEVPLDSQVGTHLTEAAYLYGKRTFPRWPGLKYLDPKTSKQFQDFAYLLAESRGYARVHLDVVFWRPASGIDNQNGG